MIGRVVRFLKWLFLPERLPPLPEEKEGKPGFFAWLVAQERLDGEASRRVQPPKPKSFFAWLFGRERLEYEDPTAKPKGRSLLSWLVSREKL